MPEPIKLIECPRDAWQGLQGQIPTEVKVQYLRALIGVGFKHIDAVSFVSPQAVPQMADSEAVLKQLDPPDDVEIIGIVVNEKGAARAIASEAVTTLGFPYSVSPTFLKQNQNQTLEEATDVLEQIDRDRRTVIGPSVYTQMVWECHNRRVVETRPAMDWIVMRNRLAHIDSRNMRDITALMDALARRVCFRLAPAPAGTPGP